jgi:hypothetical protein
LYLEGYTEIGGDKKVFLNVPLFESPVLYEFPQLCLSFGELSDGACVEQPDPEDPEYQDPNLPVEEQKRKRSDLVPRHSYSVSRRSDLVPSKFVKRRPSSRNPYFLSCNSIKNTPPYKTNKIRVQHYPSPSEIITADNTVATMIPGMECSQKKCPVDTWRIDQAKPRPQDDDDDESEDEGVVERYSWQSKFSQARRMF